jgi:hypothetical protein
MQHQTHQTQFRFRQRTDASQTPRIGYGRRLARALAPSLSRPGYTRRLARALAPSLSRPGYTPRLARALAPLSFILVGYTPRLARALAPLAASFHILASGLLARALVFGPPAFST